jgi:hypothetical protein
MHYHKNIDINSFRHFVNTHNSILLPAFTLQQSLKRHFHFHFWFNGVRVRNSLSGVDNSYIPMHEILLRLKVSKKKTPKNKIICVKPKTMIVSGASSNDHTSESMEQEIIIIIQLS